MSAGPTTVTLVNSTVATSGGFFEYITNGSCVDPLTFSIFDAAGKQVTSTLVQQARHERAARGNARPRCG